MIRCAAALHSSHHLSTQASLTSHRSLSPALSSQVKFLSVSASEAKSDLDPSTLPILIAYQNKDYVADAERVGRDKGESLTTAHVEETLLKLGVRLTASAVMREADQAALRRLRELGISEAPRGLGGSSGGADDESEEEEEESTFARRGKGSSLRIASIS